MSADLPRALAELRAALDALYPVTQGEYHRLCVAAERAGDQLSALLGAQTQQEERIRQLTEALKEVTTAAEEYASSYLSRVLCSFDGFAGELSNER